MRMARTASRPGQKQNWLWLGQSWLAIAAVAERTSVHQPPTHLLLPFRRRKRPGRPGLERTNLVHGDLRPQVGHRLNGLNRERSFTNATNLPVNSRVVRRPVSFGTRGSQVQILPLRPFPISVRFWRRADLTVPAGGVARMIERAGAVSQDATPLFLASGTESCCCRPRLRNRRLPRHSVASKRK